MTRLNRFLDLDDAARDRAATLSSLVGIAVFVLAKTLLDLDGKPLGWLTIGAVGSSYLLRLWWYCGTSQRRPERTDDRFFVPRRLAMGAASAAILVLFSVAPPAVVEAAVINRRLLMLTREKTLAPQHAKEVGSLLDIATVGSIKLWDKTRLQVYQAVKTSGLEHPDSLSILECANNIVRYTRESTFVPILDAKSITGSTEAREAYRLGVLKATAIILGPPTDPATAPTDALDAVAECTRAINLSTAQDRDLLIGATTTRAIMYLKLFEATKALEDAKTLESIGDTDLSNILDIEGIALFMRGSHDDLELSIRSFTLLTELLPPTWVTSDPQLAAMYRIDAFGNRGKAYYKLGRFENCIEDSKRVVNLLYENQVFLDKTAFLYNLKLTYLSIIAANLQLERIDEAKKEAYVWLNRSDGDPIAGSFIADVESGHFDRQAWLREYSRLP